MKALILNSGLGSRMGSRTKTIPKCMTEIASTYNQKIETIFSRQIRLLETIGINDIVVTTGYMADQLENYCKGVNYRGNITFVYNSKYETTNYIFSIYKAKEYLEDDIILMHGDLVFDFAALSKLVFHEESCMAVDVSTALPNKDFKAVLNQKNGNNIVKIGIEYFENAVAAQPLYKINYNDWHIWMEEIVEFCENGQTGCYAENAFNELNGKCELKAVDISGMLCREVDTENDLLMVDQMLKKKKSVYCCFSSDIIHGGHIKIIEAAKALGDVTVGILSDEAVASYKRYPLLLYNDRAELLSHVAGDINSVIQQDQLSYKDNLEKLKPDYVVHGDDWKTGFQSTIRQEVISVLSQWGGKLVELPYSRNESYEILENEMRSRLSIPDIRRKRLRNLLDMKGMVTALEAHSGITGLIAEKTTVLQDGKTYQFDAMWISSLCDSTAKGKPDIELVDMTSRFRTIDDIMEVTTKPIIFDGDTGGLTEHFVYTVKSLERMGVSAIIIEDKTGLKKNSLFGTEVDQTQDSIDNFSAKIKAGKRAQKTKEFMIIARIESLILEKGMEDALTRAKAFVQAGADGIMIHSRKKDPSEVFEFIENFRKTNFATPLVVVPTSFNSVKEEEWKQKGVNIVIYANQLTRSAFPAMQKTAMSILENHRSLECDNSLMSIKDILTLIPEEL